MPPLSTILFSHFLPRTDTTQGSDLLTPSDAESNSAFDNPDENANPSNDSIQAWIIVVPVLIGMLLIVSIAGWAVQRRRQKTITSLTADDGHRRGGGGSGDPIWGDGVQLQLQQQQQQQQQQKDLQYEAPPPAYEYGGSGAVGKFGTALHAEHVGDRLEASHGRLSGAQS